MLDILFAIAAACLIIGILFGLLRINIAALLGVLSIGFALSILIGAVILGHAGLAHLGAIVWKIGLIDFTVIASIEFGHFAGLLILYERPRPHTLRAWLNL